MNTTEKFDLWCVVELFGHAKIAGKCTEQNIAGTNMLRVDVPETEKQPAFSRFFGSAAIYAINPVDEATAKFFAQQLEVKPIQSWDVKEMLLKNNQLLLSAQQVEADRMAQEEEMKAAYATGGDDDAAFEDNLH